MKHSLPARILATSFAALLVQLAVQFGIGLFLSRAYKPIPDAANDTVRRLLEHQPHAFFAGLHYWGSMVLLIHGVLHLAMSFIWECYRPPTHWRWWGSLLILLSLFLWQLTGNLLPFDKHGVQTAVIEGSIAARVPLVGQDVSHLMMQGPNFGGQTLAAWYTTHRWIIAVICVLGIVATLASPAKKDSKANKIAMFLPLVIGIALALFIARPLGTEATAADYNRYDASVGWYTLFMHGTLQAFDRLGGQGWIGSALLPAILVLFLFALPWLSKRLTHTMLQLYMGIFVLVFVGCGIAFGSRVAPLTGTRDPVVAEAAPPRRETPETRIVDQALFERGRTVFNSEGCANCHGTDGKKASGGPDLTNVHQEHSEPEWFVRFIKDPKSVKPSSTMPAFPLEQEKLRALAEFLSFPR